MVNVATQHPRGYAQNLARAAWEENGVLEPKSTARQAAARAETVRDTVSLSESGQKIVNLGRGKELASDIRKAPLDKDFFTALRNASRDIFRISRLFGETIRASFMFRR